MEFDYVHGKADLRNDIQSTNMVLGIDEYLEEMREIKTSNL